MLIESITIVQALLGLVVSATLGGGSVMGYIQWSKNRTSQKQKDNFINLSKMFNLEVKKNEKLSKRKEQLTQKLEQCNTDNANKVDILQEKIFSLEKELIEKDKLFSLFLTSNNSNAFPSWTKSVDSTYIWANEEFGRLFNVDINTIEGKRDEVLFDNWKMYVDNDNRLKDSKYKYYVDINTELPDYTIIKWKEMRGDVLLAINGMAVKTPKELQDYKVFS